MNKLQELKQNAENCADLAAEAKDEKNKRRYERMRSLECACKNAGLA